MAEKKFYWLKLKRDFFKRHDIRIIEEMPNGKEYILFYLKLLLESIDHEGTLRFSDTVPYNEQMLSVITNTNIDIVRSAMKMFIELNMIEMFADETIYMAEVNKLIGSETQKAELMRKSRARKKALESGNDVTELLPSVTNCYTEIEIDIEKEQDKEKDTEVRPQKYKRTFTKPTLEEVQAYCKERNNNVDAKAFFDYYSTGDWKDAKGKPVRNWKQKVITWERGESNGRTNKRVTDVTDYGYPDEC